MTCFSLCITCVFLLNLLLNNPAFNQPRTIFFEGDCYIVPKDERYWCSNFATPVWIAASLT